jgi:hypothetical protein
VLHAGTLSGEIRSDVSGSLHLVFCTRVNLLSPNSLEASWAITETRDFLCFGLAVDGTAGIIFLPAVLVTSVLQAGAAWSPLGSAAAQPLGSCRAQAQGPHSASASASRGWGPGPTLCLPKPQPPAFVWELGLHRLPPAWPQEGDLWWQGRCRVSVP